MSASSTVFRRPAQRQTALDPGHIEGCVCPEPTTFAPRKFAAFPVPPKSPELPRQEEPHALPVTDPTPALEATIAQVARLLALGLRRSLARRGRHPNPDQEVP